MGNMIQGSELGCGGYIGEFSFFWLKGGFVQFWQECGFGGGLGVFFVVEGEVAGVVLGGIALILRFVGCVYSLRLEFYKGIFKVEMFFIQLVNYTEFFRNVLFKFVIIWKIVF